MKELIETIAKALVDDVDAVHVTEVDGDQSVIVELEVAREDIGKVIGREGRAAQSMRTLLNAASAKSGRRFQLDIID